MAIHEAEAVANIIVVRHGPDWLSYDLENSRAFLRSIGLAEDLVIEFASVWDRSLRVDYRSIRAGMTAIAWTNLSSVENSVIETSGQLDKVKLQAASRVAFVDDDDWFSTKVFVDLPMPDIEEDGIYWGSLRIGRPFGAAGPAAPFVYQRPLDQTIYTNNYAITQRAVERFGLETVFEHTSAQEAFSRDDFVESRSPAYLSCAVKHPCCTLSACYLMTLDSFRRDPRREVAAFVESARDSCSAVDDDWIATSLGEVCGLFEDAL